MCLVKLRSVKKATERLHKRETTQTEKRNLQTEAAADGQIQTQQNDLTSVLSVHFHRSKPKNNTDEPEGRKHSSGSAPGEETTRSPAQETTQTFTQRGGGAKGKKWMMTMRKRKAARGRGSELEERMRKEVSEQ